MSDATSEAKRKKIAKRLKVLDAFRESGNKPERMILEVIPVLPPDLRPLVPLDGGRFATSDLNDLYRRVINRNNRLKRLLEINAPEVIIRNEKRMLQEAVDALFDNGRRGRVITGAEQAPAQVALRHAQGQAGPLPPEPARQARRLLGPLGDRGRARSCGCTSAGCRSKHGARAVQAVHLLASSRSAATSPPSRPRRRWWRSERPEVWDILAEVIQEHPVLLNRAPTLHRLGMQAFEPVLIDGKAIQLHPLVCQAFNADFDGDQMAVHVPLSVEAQIEARVLMMSTNNILSSRRRAADHRRRARTSCSAAYYLTRERRGARGEGMALREPRRGARRLRRRRGRPARGIKVRMGEGELVDTTAGRVLLNEIVPASIRFEIINE